MKLIAENPVEVRIRPKIEAIHDVQGRMIEPAKRAVVAKFQRGVAPQWAREIGLANFRFPTCPADVEQATWVAYVDTDEEAASRGWTDEEHEEAITRLKEIAGEYGYIHVEQPRAAAPWPAYDNLVAKGNVSAAKVADKIAAKVREDGYDAQTVAAYERETLNRPEVLAALEALAEPAEPEAEEELVSA